MWSPILLLVLINLLPYLHLVLGQQNCYYGPGAGFRGPSELVPCNNTGTSACCLLGDTCLSGSTCYNYATGNLYQYGCNDISYTDESCPMKCGWDPAKSPWIGLEYCSDIQDLTDTWTCLSPESCGCEWKGSYALQILPSRACGAMGSEARVALYAPSTLLPYVSLPSTYGGTTKYYSTTTDTDGALSVISTAIVGYTPVPFTQYTTYRELDASVIYINPGATASPSTQSSAYIYTDTTPPAAPSVAPTPSISLSSTLTSATTISAATKPVATHTVTPTTVPVSSGLSTGAKAGIGAGIAGGACLLAALGFCCFLVTRRRKNKADVQQPPQYSQGPPMGPYMQGQQPSGWAPFPPGGVPFYVVPGPSMVDKDGAVVNISPPYSPPHSPPPPTELSTDQRRQTQESGSLHPGATSPRTSTAHSGTASPRYA